MSSTMVGVTVAIMLAITGKAADLIGFFSIVGASFGPIAARWWLTICSPAESGPARAGHQLAG